MNKLLSILCLFLIMSCNKEPEIDYALISGQITNPKGDKLVIYKGQELVKEININQEGMFADTLKLDSGYYTLVHGRENSIIYIANSYDLNLKIDTQQFDESLTYDGMGSESNNYLALKYLTDEKLSGDFTEVYALEEKAFLNKVNMINDAKLKLLNEVENIDPDFKKLEVQNLEFEHLLNLQNYPTYHPYYAKKKDFKASAEFLGLLDGIDYTNKELYEEIDNYKRLVLMHYNNRIHKSENPSEVFKEINENTSDQFKDDLSKNLAYEITPNNEYNEAFYDGIIAISSDQQLKDRVKSKFEIVKKLQKGMPSPSFLDYENHKGGTVSLDDLKGKYVYVDVWATWCGPCKVEIPYLKEVEHKFKGKKIEFVSTSIDKADDHSAWVKMVKDQSLGGLQLMADNDWNSQFIKEYAIEGIPRFILIDPKGNIVTADAPRPSNPELVSILESLDI